MRIKEILYIFISDATAKSIIEKAKTLVKEKEKPEYQLSYEPNPNKYNFWTDHKVKAVQVVAELKMYMPKEELEKVLKEFEKMAKIILEYGKVSLAGLNQNLTPDSDKYSYDQIENSEIGWLAGEHIYEILTSKIDQSIYDQKQKYKKKQKKIISRMFWNDFPLGKFMQKLQSLLFTITFPQKNTRPILKKINQTNNL